MANTINKLRIMYWNIRGIVNPSDKQKKYKLFDKIIKDNYDICILSEWSTARKYITPETDEINCFKTLINKNYKVYYQTSDVCVIIKTKINHKLILRSYTNKERKLPFNNTIHTTYIQIETPSHTLGIGGYYNSPSYINIAKPQQLIDILNQQDDFHQIMIGDMNIRHPVLGDEDDNHMGTEFVYDIQDSYYDIYNPDQPTHKEGGKLDLVIASQDINKHLNSIRVHPEWNAELQINSDHYPISFNYQFTHQQATIKPYRTWNLNSKKWNEYYKILERNFNPKNFSIRSIDNIDLAWQNIKQLWLKVANSTIGKKTIYPKPQPWWTKKVHEIRKHFKRISRRNQRLKKSKKLKQKHIREYKKIRNKKNHIIRKAKRQLKQTITQTILHNDSSNKAFWKAINNFENSKRKKPLPVFKINNTTVTNNLEKINAIHNILKNPPQPKNPTEYDKKHYKNIDKWIKENIITTNIKFDPIKHMPKPPKYKYDIYDPKLDNPNPFQPIYEKRTHSLKDIQKILNNPITVKEINLAIQDIDPSKAMGPDHIHNKMLKNTGPNLRKVLQIIFNISWTTACHNPKRVGN